MKHIFLVLIFCIACTQASVTKRSSDREHDGFVGPVKKVFVQWSPIYPADPNIPIGSRCRTMTKIYDESGRLIQHSLYPGSCGGDEMREDYTYAQDGSRKTKTKEIRGKDSPPPPPPIARPNSEWEKGEPREVFKYDSSGKLTEMVSIKPSGKVGYKLTYSYDARGRMVEMDSHHGDGDVTRRVYSYSGDGRFPSGFTYISGKGRVGERTAYSDYEFNSHGDWIKRKETTEETFNRRSISITFREIEYYPDGK